MRGAYNLTKCPDKSAKLLVTVKSIYISEVKEGDNVSLGSICSMSSK